MKVTVGTPFLAILLTTCGFLTNLSAQTAMPPGDSALLSPVAIPMLLAGNFAEPRLNHFHSGIDIRTNGATGIPVRAVADGYVSRIKVEAGGYGKALYVRHPNGLTTVSAHLDGFSEAVSAFVKSEQYRRESFAVDLFPEASAFPVKRGQVIAFSGNSGSSEGPHLHFEFRETQSENPVNPLEHLLVIADGTPPVLEKLFVYSLKDKRNRTKPLTVPLVRRDEGYKTLNDQEVFVDEVTGFGIQGYDLADGSANRLGFYRIRAWIDEDLFFDACMDEFAFSETRFMNSFMDYRQYLGSRKPVIKLFTDPNNRSSLYRFVRNRGIIRSESPGTLKISVEDASGNSAVARLKFRPDPTRFVPDPEFIPYYDAFFSYGENNTFTGTGVRIEVPAGALYDDLFFNYESLPAIPGSFSRLHRIHHADVPVHTYFSIALDPEGLPDRLRPRALVYQVGESGRYSCFGGTWEGGTLVARTRNFGDYCILADTVAPEIKPANFTGPDQLRSLKEFRFRASDALSGIRQFRGEIDGQWILLEFDPKNSMLLYKFDPQRVKKSADHRLRVVVTDQAGNTATYSASFTR